jgi:nicotinate phosphoribosyltransferase
VPVLAIVSEAYNRHAHPRPDFDEGRRRLAQKTTLINDVRDPAFRIADYGTRRRFSYRWQDEVVRTLKRSIGPKFVGTSNVKLALDHGLTPLGTMAHEYLQACQAVGPRLRDSQVYAFNTWSREYRGDLGIALSDVFGMEAFLRDFDLFFCKLFDGVRHDSGDPFEWGEKLIAHYQRMRIDPRTKTMVFSDSLNIPLAIRLFEYFRGRSQIAFGVGTNLTNDLGYEPLSIVIKMTRCNGQPVAKISDEPSKAMDYDPSYVAYLREVFQIPAPAAEKTPA